MDLVIRVVKKRYFPKFVCKLLIKESHKIESKISLSLLFFASILPYYKVFLKGISLKEFWLGKKDSIFGQTLDLLSLLKEEL
ncbi:MAG: hypothetical protein ABIN61_00825 [candidate division WOR-3 bacterium]